MTQKNQVFITNVVVTNSTWEAVASSVISWLVSVIAKLNSIVKICKYKRASWGAPFYFDDHGSAQCTQAWYGSFH